MDKKEDDSELAAKQIFKGLAKNIKHDLKKKDNAAVYIFVSNDDQFDKS